MVKLFNRRGKFERLKYGLAAGAMFAVTAGSTFALPARAHATDAYLQNAMQSIVDGGFPGAWAVDSVYGGAAAGVANIANNTPTNSGMKLRIGSVTKSFVGAVALQLVDENSLELTDTVEQWLPGLLPYGSNVTVKQLLQHTSGIPDYLESGDNPLLLEFIRKSVPGNPEYDPNFKFTSWAPADLVGLVSSQPRHTLPANEAEYSDTNYIVLGMIIEEVTNSTVPAQVYNRFLSPWKLNLSHTSFPVNSSSMPSNSASGYSYNLDEFGSPIVGTKYNFTNYNPSIGWATGAMISNPTDMNKFMKALLGGQLLSTTLTAQMKQTVPITLPEGLFAPGFGAGLGIWSWKLNETDPSLCNKTIYGHEGEAPGYDTWSFASSNGSKAISMGVNLMVPDWDAYYAAEMPGYASLWCR